MAQSSSNGSADNTTTGTTTTGQNLSAEEIALYDRQIRLWGAQAQERIRSAHILLVSLRALGNEIAKNLILAGISSLTIIDDEPINEDDFGAQYFLRDEDLGKPRAQCAIPRLQELNPRVTVKSGGSLSGLLLRDQTYYEPFDCVIACDHDFMTLSMINTAARFASRPFYAAGIHGFYGYIFADLVGHEFVVEREKSNIATAIGQETMTRSIQSVTSKKESNGKSTEIVKKQEIYCPLILANSSPLPIDVTSNRRKLKSVPALLPCLRALFDFQRTYAHLPGHNSQDLAAFTALATTKSRELQLPPETLRADFLRSFIQNIGSEIVPVAAFVGGRVSEDVINVLSKKEQPIQNFALFDGDGLEGRIYSLYSPPPELAMGMNGMDPMAAGAMDMSAGAGLGQMGDISGADMMMDDGSGMMGMGGTGALTGMHNGVMLPNMGIDNGMGGALAQSMALNNAAVDSTMHGSSTNSGPVAGEAPRSVPSEGADVAANQS